MATVELPPFDAEQQQLSDQFVALMRERIVQHGPVSFREFMQQSLYADGLGYYVNGYTKLGRHGDFTTAPEISDDFAFSLATQCQQVLGNLVEASVLEFGGGSGRLAVDLLRLLAQKDCLPDQYLILDVSPDLRHSQKVLLQEQLPAEVFAKVHWITQLPVSFSGVIIANEVLDAFAVERFVMIDGVAQQLMVDWRNNQFELFSKPDPDVAEAVAQIQIDAKTELPDGTISEYCPMLAPWWHSLADCMHHAAILVCDYGANRANYYAALKPTGTLRCFYRHLVHDDPFARPALQDITADVDFTAVAISATEAGLELQGYTPLTEFMLSNGVLEYHQQKIQSLSSTQQIVATGNLKRVIMSEEMGDRFMVIGFSKGLDLTLGGFARADWSRML